MPSCVKTYVNFDVASVCVIVFDFRHCVDSSPIGDTSGPTHFSAWGMCGWCWVMGTLSQQCPTPSTERGRAGPASNLDTVSPSLALPSHLARRGAERREGGSQGKEGMPSLWLSSFRESRVESNPEQPWVDAFASAFHFGLTFRHIY